MAFAVDAEGGRVEAWFTFEFATQTATGMNVGAMGPGTEDTGWWLDGAESQMLKSSTGAALGGGVEIEVVCSHAASPNDREELPGIVSRIVSYKGENY